MGIFQCDCIYFLSGLNLKTLVIDLSKDEVRAPVFIRAEQGWKVADLKAEIAEVCICLSIFPIGHSIRCLPRIVSPCTVVPRPISPGGFYHLQYDLY